eukprot:gnl/TRDRNA2_/TRDRNA2_27876_c0_seq1.p1 gnl/TRDRNA2_/TRDRNA2_27876_c0~~gnl/TRDRNA2_/TRDRNA2_27876_c0_seq1.p1  ORF type:complete len:204 (+),score=54.55 gnl/TRDRNA2_/TRDRNA2_27876_c0_seq1:101-712(+)
MIGAGNFAAVHGGLRHKKGPRPPQSTESAAKREQIYQEAQEQSERNKEVIKGFDNNESGMLEASQLKEYLVELNMGKDVTDDEVAYIMSICDTDKNKAISSSELEQVSYHWNSYMIALPEITSLMAKHDPNNSGRLEREQLKRLLYDLNDGREVTDEQADWVLKEADFTGKGVITKPQVKKVIMLWKQKAFELKQKDACCTVS